MYTLRTSTKDDLHFLFDVSTKAMQPVREIIKPDLELDLVKGFKDYSEKFEPEKIQVIQFDGEDVGRFRIVRSEEEIYVGGIQILPQFQNKGIGSEIFKDLVKEANDLQKIIRLKVSKVNKIAKKFYEKYDFVSIGEEGTDFIMKYTPR